MTARRRSTDPAQRTGPSEEVEETPPDALWSNLRDGHRMLRAELQEVLREGGIYLAEYRALARLKDRQMTMGALAEALGLTPASMTDLTRQLVARGWIVRGRSPTDRRVYLVEATADGLRAHRTSRTEYQRRLLQIDRAIPPGARQGLSDGLRELIKVLDTRRRARGPVAP